MLAGDKVRIKTDEQARKRKKKRPETETTKKKKTKLDQLKTDNKDVKTKDKETEQSWSMINIDNAKDLLTMGLVSLEVLDEDEVMICRPGKRKNTAEPKSSDLPTAKEGECETMDMKEMFKERVVQVNASTCASETKSQKRSFSEKKEFVKQKRKEKIAKTRLERSENPNSEKELLRKEKMKAKRKERKAKKRHEKQLKAEIDSFISDKKSGVKNDVISVTESIQPAPSESVDVKVVVPESTETDQTEHAPDVNPGEPLEILESDTAVLDNVAAAAVGPTAETDAVQTDAAESAGPAVQTDAAEPTVEAESEDEDTESENTATATTPAGVSQEPAVVLTDHEKEEGKKWLDLGVCDGLVKGLVELGFTTPTPIQQACIPAGLLKYKDVIGAAETGSGKTLAFGIPLIQRVMRLKSEGCIKGLVMCPTRELALQVTDHLRAVSKHTGVRIVPIVGGIAAPKQERLLSYRPPILVATPGRLWQLIQEHQYLQSLETIKFLVIDEADRMVEDGHFEEMTKIIGRLPDKDHRNTFLFSATLTFTIEKEDEKAKKKKKTKKEKRAEKRGSAGLEMLVRNIGVKDKVEIVDFTLKKGTAELLTETYFLCNIEDKDVHLYYLLLNHPGKTLVFANSIDGVMNLVHIMKLLELPVYPLHSSLQQRQRFKFLDRFKEQDNGILICTDIAARGLDIPSVDTVIHYQLPPTREAYIHRSGRTARADNPGLSIAIVGAKDFKSYKKLSSQMSEFPIENTRLKVLRPPMEIARKIFKLERLRTRPVKREAKLVALAKEAGLEEVKEEDVEEQAAEAKRETKILRAQLNQLFKQPVIDPTNTSRYASAKGSAADSFQTLSTFSLGVSALEHTKKKT